MKKLCLFFCLGLFAFSYQPAQSQCIEEGKFILDAYWGWPNMWTTVLKDIVRPNDNRASVGSFGPMGGRFEYLLSDKVGLGADVHSATSSVSWDSTWASGSYDYKVSVTRLRICPRVFYHFNSNENLDFYGTFGIGYRNTNVKVATNDPQYGTDKVSVTLAPITWRAAIGLRYFFTENIGASMEMGLGGVLATGGISLKF